MNVAGKDEGGGAAGDGQLQAILRAMLELEMQVAGELDSGVVAALGLIVVGSLAVLSQLTDYGVRGSCSELAGRQDCREEGTVMNKWLWCVLIIAGWLALPGSAWAQSLTCGLKPIPDVGCRIGRCVNGAWEQVCDQSPALVCGIKPIPNVGCRIGRCVNGEWEQVCDQSPSLTCGIKPIPAVGCRIGRCIDGEWEQVCD